MEALLKTSAYLGAVLLLGAGLYGYVIAQEVKPRRWLRVGALVGVGLLLVGSAGDLVWTLFRLTGRFDPALTLEYTLTTLHGRWMMARLGLALVALFILLTARWRVPFALASVGLLTSFSALSHGAAMYGPPALLADLGHTVAATLWGGAILYTALGWRGLGAHREGALGRVSSLGLGSVGLLFATGIYASLLHIERPEVLTTTLYGRTLLVKLALVGVILGIAALNRWHFLPKLRAHGYGSGTLPHRFGQVLLLEAALLLTVFAVTGVLTTSPLPHD